MDYDAYIRNGLKAQGLPAKDGDIEGIKGMLETINEEQKNIQDFPGLKEKLPIKSFDKGVVDNG